MAEDGGPKKHDNQYTSPPLTPQEAARRVRTQLLRQPKEKCRQPKHDWERFILEWGESDKARYPTIDSFAKSKGFHPGALQRRGGRTLWYQFRDAIHRAAFQKALDKAPARVARQYESGLEVVDLLKGVAKKYARRLMMDPERPEPLKEGATAEERKAHDEAMKEYKRQLRQVPADAIKTLSEAAEVLNDTTQRLFGDTNAKREGGATINFQQIIGELGQRDASHGVVDADGA